MCPLSTHLVGTPGERIAIDVLGLLLLSDSGNKYILHVVDYFTKWPEAYPLQNQEAATVAEALVKEYVCWCGVPLSLHSDQGHNLKVTCSRKCANSWEFERLEPHPYTLSPMVW